MNAPHEHDYQLHYLDGDNVEICTTCGEVAPPDHRSREAAQITPAGGQLQQVSDDQIAALFDTPPLDIVGWARALAENAAYDDDGDASPELDMVVAILTAQSSDEAMAVTNVKTANDLLGTEPGAHSPLLQITGARPLKSTFKDGPPCFAIVDATIKATGEQIKLSCGGRTVQAVILAHVNRGWLPFECVLVRRLKATRAGFYPLNLEAGG